MGTNETKECRFCYSTIDARATVCPNCRRDLEPASAASETVSKKESKSKLGVLLILILAACGALYLFGSLGRNGTSPTPIRRTIAPTSYVVQYRVTGSGLVDLTYENESGNTEQLSAAAVPWSKLMAGKRYGDFVYVSAQRDERRGVVKCEIWVDSKLIKEAESFGPFTIATCSGSVGRD
jgi:hypothetical protein